MNYSGNNKEVNSIVKDTESESETKKIAIHSIVVGLKYEGRQAKLKKLINQLKKDDYFYEKYDGLTNKEIKDDYSYTDEDDPIWELTNEYLPYSLNCNIKCIKNFKNLYRQRITQ